MDFKKKAPASTRWITPFPESDPELSIEVRILAKAEMVRIYDKHKVRPGADGALLGQILGVQEDLVKASVTNWQGMLEEGTPIPCNDKNKVKYLVEYEIQSEDGESTNLWLVINQRLAEALEAEQKN